MTMQPTIPKTRTPLYVVGNVKHKHLNELPRYRTSASYISRIAPSLKVGDAVNITPGYWCVFYGGGYMDAIEGGSWEGKVDMSDPSFLVEGE